MNKYKSMGLINVKKYMKDAGLQSKDVADRMNVRPETISRWVSGTNTPGLDQTEELAHILNVTVSDILFKQRGMRIAGTNNYKGEVKFYDSMSEVSYLPMPGMDTPSHRFCLKVDTHQQEDKHSYNAFSDIHINNKEISSLCYTMRSLVKIKKGPEKLVGKVYIGVLFPAPNTADGKLQFTFQETGTNDIILNLELEWATPLLSRFYNRNQSEVLDIIDIDGHDL